MQQNRLSRLDRYVDALPGGLDAYPACRAKGALVRNLLEQQPIDALLKDLPEPLRALAADPPLGSDWIPEVHFDALLLAIADLRGLSDAEVRDWSRARNRALFRSPVYRTLMAVASPAKLLRFAAQRWANWHRGSTLAIEGITDQGVLVALDFPPGLFDETLQRIYGEAFVAALELANATDPMIELVEASRTRARYRASWS